jgi:hypothetical protein
MALTSAPWAIDGARTPASVARLAARAAVKQSGIINPGDMKVLPLAVPGDGVRISSGGAVLENRYELDVNQAYVVEATSEEILGADDNFTGIIGNGTTQSHLICVTVADPQYSTAGHPWFTEVMKSDLVANPENALDFQYVRAWVIKNVPAGTVRVEDLGVPPAYPVYALARIDVPNGSGSITSGMIVDLREVVNRREKTVQNNVGVSTPDTLSVAGSYVYETWPDNSEFTTYVPKWATKVYVQAYINGFTQGSDTDVDAAMRVEMRKSDGTFIAACQQSLYYADPAFLPKGTDKIVNISGPISIPSANRGTTCKFSTAATLASTTMNTRVGTTTRTSTGITLRFVEEAV